ncbi:MAG: NUDIX hydrolase [SAR202 cluster bacterium]|nr:ADP-ribose pyrophosphatase [Chloroflexota bacterium]MQG51355.1 NUDIX hydrolase [SAR202 cluster bacterium]
MDEKTISSKLIYDGEVIKMKVDTVKLTNGIITTREIINHNGSVAIVALDNDKVSLLMVRQYRKAVEEAILEVPSGTLELDEDPLDCAYRELEEETGYIAKHMEKIGSIMISPGFLNEKTDIYFAKDLTFSNINLDEDEILLVEKYSIKEILELINREIVTDAMTIAAMHYAIQKGKISI